MELPDFLTGGEPAIPAAPESGLPTGAPEGFIPPFNEPAPAAAPTTYDFSGLEQILGAEGQGIGTVVQPTTADPIAPVAAPQEATGGSPESASPYADLDPEVLEIARRIQNQEGLYGHLHRLAQENLQQYGGNEEAVLSQLLAPDVATVTAQVDARLRQMYEAQGAEYDPTLDPNQAVMRQMLYEQQYQEAQRNAMSQFRETQVAQTRQRQAIEQALTQFPNAERNAVLTAARSGIDPLSFAKQLHDSTTAQLERMKAEILAQQHPARQAPSPLAGRAQQSQAAQGVGNLSLPPVPDGIKDPAAFAEYERQLMAASQRLRRA